MAARRRNSRGRSLGLALGGGAARGFAHLGVLKVLAEEGIQVKAVAGTSAGSLVGALYCAGKSWEEIRAIGHRIDWPDLVSPTWPTLGLVRTDKLEKVIDRLLEGRTEPELRSYADALVRWRTHENETKKQAFGQHWRDFTESKRPWRHVH